MQDAALAYEVALRDAHAHAIRPSVRYAPRLAMDGNMWHALYGEDQQMGVSGFGRTPEQALVAFDIAWRSNSGSHIIE